MKMNLELKTLGTGVGKFLKGIASTYVLPSALKVSEWPVVYPSVRGENAAAGMAVVGMVASSMITMLVGSLALDIAERPDLIPYVGLAAIGGTLTNVVSGACEYRKVLKKEEN